MSLDIKRQDMYLPYSKNVFWTFSTFHMDTKNVSFIEIENGKDRNTDKQKETI